MLPSKSEVTLLLLVSMFIIVLIVASFLRSIELVGLVSCEIFDDLCVYLVTLKGLALPILRISPVYRS